MLRRLVMISTLVLSASMPHTLLAETSCDMLLKDCAETVEAQQKTIQVQEKKISKQGELIKKQDEVITEQDKEIKRSHKAEDTAVKTGFSVSGFLLLLLLL